MSDLPPPRYAYRGAATLHGILAVVILVIAAITGGNVAKAFAVAVAYFVVATGWSWFRFRQRETRVAGRPSKGNEGGERR